MACAPSAPAGATTTHGPRAMPESEDARIFLAQVERARSASSRMQPALGRVGAREVERAQFAAPRSRQPPGEALPSGWGLGASRPMVHHAAMPTRPGLGPSADLGTLGPRVDIYLSAGPNVGYGASGGAGDATWNVAGYASCNRDDPRNCAIWRVRLRLGMAEPIEVEQVVRATAGAVTNRAWSGVVRTGASMPALSYDGRYLAFRRQNYGDADPPGGTGFPVSSQVVVRDLHTQTDLVVDGGDDVRDALRFPAWYVGDRLLYNRGTDPARPGAGTLYSARLDFRAGVAHLQPGWLGAEGAAYTETDFNDPAVAPDSGGGGVSSRRIATFGENAKTTGAACGVAEEGVPRVHRGLAPTEDEFECFSLGVNRGDREINSCQHPSWSLDGTAIYCWQHNPEDVSPENREAVLALPYVYRPSKGSESWSQVTDGETAFTELLASALEEQFGGLFPALPSGAKKGGPYCRVTAYKHAMECGTANFMVMTLFCSDATYNNHASGDVFSSRVVLVRKEPLTYWDLTGMIETTLGQSPGTLHGIYADCGAALG